MEGNKVSTKNTKIFATLSSTLNNNDKVQTEKMLNMFIQNLKGSKCQKT